MPSKNYITLGELPNMKKYLEAPIVAIILTNIIPLLGVLFWGYKAFNIVFLYWFEFLISGLFIFFKSSSSLLASIKSSRYRFLVLVAVSNYFYFSFIVIFFAPHFLNNTSYLPLFISGLKRAFIFGFNETKIAIFSLLTGSLYRFLVDKKYTEKLLNDFNGKFLILHITILLVGSIASRFSTSQIIILFFLILLKTDFEITTYKREYQKPEELNIKT